MSNTTLAKMSVILLSAPSCGLDAGDVQALMADVRYRFWDAARSYDYYLRTCSYDLVGELLLCKASSSHLQRRARCRVPRHSGPARGTARHGTALGAAASGAP